MSRNECAVRDKQKSEIETKAMRAKILHITTPNLILTGIASSVTFANIHNNASI